MEKKQDIKKINTKDLRDLQKAIQDLLIWEENINQMKAGDRLTETQMQFFKPAGYKIMELGIKYSK